MQGEIDGAAAQFNSPAAMFFKAPVWGGICYPR